jgi:hypothetical protein
MFKPEFIKRGDGGGGCVDGGTTFASTETIVGDGGTTIIGDGGTTIIGDGGSLGMSGNGQKS